jgi:hypothetical protein
VISIGPCHSTPFSRFNGFLHPGQSSTFLLDISSKSTVNDENFEIFFKSFSIASSRGSVLCSFCETCSIVITPYELIKVIESIFVVVPV